MRAGVFGTAALSLCALISAVSVGYAQSPPPSAQPGAAAPLPGFVPPYEITKIVRAAGYDPLTRPRREGTTYVVRATNHRGILMRIVVDARTGAIRAVNRIVPGPAPYGVVGVMGPPPYGGPYDPPIGPLPGPPPPYAAGPYGPAPYPPPYPPPYDAPGYGMTPDMLEPMEPGGPMEADLNTPPPPPPYIAHSHPAPSSGAPLPRSRPSEFATHEAKPPRSEKPAEAPAVKSAPAPSAAVTTPAAVPAAPATPAPAAVPAAPPLPPAAAAPAKKPPPFPPIQD